MIGLTPEENARILRTDNGSFFRLEFYKVPESETPNSTNRKLVFTKQLPISVGEKVTYTPINEQIHVPVFVGSNYRNTENLYLYWFQDDSILDGTQISGNTFYMVTKFYNAIDGTSLTFLNKDKTITETINEEEDIYRKVVIDKSDYSYAIYSGVTEDYRVSVSEPIRCFASSESGRSIYPIT